VILLRFRRAKFQPACSLARLLPARRTRSAKECDRNNFLVSRDAQRSAWRHLCMNSPVRAFFRLLARGIYLGRQFRHPTPVLRYSEEPDRASKNPALRSTSEPASSANTQATRPLKKHRTRYQTEKRSSPNAPLRVAANQSPNCGTWRQSFFFSRAKDLRDSAFPRRLKRSGTLSFQRPRLGIDRDTQSLQGQHAKNRL